MYLADYRARSVIVSADLARSFRDERLSVDVTFIYASTNDALANNASASPCVGAPTSFVTLQNSCYGQRAGSEYEAGVTITAQPFTRWFGFLDYRLVADLSGGNLPGVTPAAARPTVLTHVLLLESRCATDFARWNARCSNHPGEVTP